MPKTSKATASKVESVEGILESRSEDLDGYITSFESYMADMDPAPFFKGLPDDRVSVSALGLCDEGQDHLPVRRQGDETYEAGDAFYAPPGHTPVLSAGCELVEFSPTDQAEKTMEVVNRNIAASEQA